MKKEDAIRTFKIERLKKMIMESHGCGIVTKMAMLALLDQGGLRLSVMAVINGPEEILRKIQDDVHFMNSSCGPVDLGRITKSLDIPFSFQATLRDSACELYLIRTKDLANAWRECAKMVEISVDLTAKEEVPPRNNVSAREKFALAIDQSRQLTGSVPCGYEDLADFYRR